MQLELQQTSSTQRPDAHCDAPVHALPFGRCVEQEPVGVPTHVPEVHVSLTVQGWPSSHVVPLSDDTEQDEVPLQLRVLQSSLVQVIAVPAHEPAVHVSLYVQSWPSLHGLPVRSAVPHVLPLQVDDLHGSFEGGHVTAIAKLPSMGTSLPSQLASPFTLLAQTLNPYVAQLPAGGKNEN